MPERGKTPLVHSVAPTRRGALARRLAPRPTAGPDPARASRLGRVATRSSKKYMQEFVYSEPTYQLLAMQSVEGSNSRARCPRPRVQAGHAQVAESNVHAALQGDKQITNRPAQLVVVDLSRRPVETLTTAQSRPGRDAIGHPSAPASSAQFPRGGLSRRTRPGSTSGPRARKDAAAPGHPTLG